MSRRDGRVDWMTIGCFAAVILVIVLACVSYNAKRKACEERGGVYQRTGDSAYACFAPGVLR